MYSKRDGWTEYRPLLALLKIVERSKVSMFTIGEITLFINSYRLVEN